MQPDLTTSAKPPQPDTRAIQARAFAIAQSQLGPIFQTGFMMWLMIPNALNLFSIIFMTTMGLTPFRNIMNVNAGEGAGDRQALCVTIYLHGTC